MTMDAEAAPADSQPAITRQQLGFRILYSAVLCIALNIASAALGFVFCYQVLYGLITERRPAPRVTRFGQMLSAYVYEVFRYITFNRDAAPFPFSDWDELAGGNNKS
ncbi:MAG: hypothetical protein ACI841_002315 [Planctomycetota bacterium]|jgi:hypothetical protein